MSYLNQVKNQAGVAHILLLVAALGLIGFIAISSSVSFKDKLFSRLFPKPFSHAVSEPISGPVSPSPTPIPTPEPDIVAPTVSISSPANNSYVKGDKVGIRASASDNIGVTKVEFYVDVALLSTITTSPYGVYWNTTALADGSTHTITAKAYDAAGNYAKAAVTVTIDNTVPQITITSPTNGSSVTVGSVVTLSTSASDNIGVRQVEFRVNKTKICTDKTAPYSCNWTVPATPSVTYDIQARVTDKAGNTAQSSVSVTSQ